MSASHRWGFMGQQYCLAREARLNRSVKGIRLVSVRSIRGGWEIDEPRTCRGGWTQSNRLPRGVIFDGRFECGDVPGERGSAQFWPGTLPAGG